MVDAGWSSGEENASAVSAESTAKRVFASLARAARVGVEGVPARAETCHTAALGAPSRASSRSSGSAPAGRAAATARAVATNASGRNIEPPGERAAPRRLLPFSGVSISGAPTRPRARTHPVPIPAHPLRAFGTAISFATLL